MVDRLGLRDLELIRLVAETGSVTSAANRMHVTQPAASQRLASAQERVGMPLFRRHDGRMEPTPIGRRLVLAAAAVQRELDSAATDLRNLHERRERRLRLTTQCYTCYRWLPQVLRDIEERFPTLALDVVPDATEDPYGALDEDRVDVAIVSHPQPNRPYRELPLFADELYAVMHSGHSLARRHFLNPENFEGEDLVLYTGERHLFLEEVLFPAGVSPGRRYQARMTEAIVELARAGFGIAVLAGWAFHDLDSREGLVAVRIGRGGMKRRWHAVISPDAAADAVQAVVESLRQMGRSIGDEAWRAKLARRARRAREGARR